MNSVAMVELRSDTFTQPTASMRAAMAAAEVGNDDDGEDLAVIRLEEHAADRVVKQAACLMPSGTMANLTTVLTQVPRGAKLILGRESDIYHCEGMGAGVLGGVGYEAVPNEPDGTLALPALATALPEDDDDPQFARARPLCSENPQDRCGGVVIPQAWDHAAQQFAGEHRLRLHLDGARLFKAEVASGRPAADITGPFDTVQFCLSKGLGAPIGSIVCGVASVVTEIRRWRKVLGGAMRRAEVIAAAGLIALQGMVCRLADDDHRAAQLAAALAEIDGVECTPPQTNVVLFAVPGFAGGSGCAGHRIGQGRVAVLAFGHGRIRAVTHLGIDDQALAAAITEIRQVLG